MLDFTSPGNRSVTPSLEGVLERARTGEAKARRELVEASLGTLYRRALRLSARVETARRWVKATYLESFRGLVSGELDKSAFENLDSGFTGVLLREVQRALRDDLSPPVPDSELPRSEGATLPELEAMLAELTPPQRFALVLRELESLPADDTRALLGFLGTDVDEALAAAMSTLERRAGPDGLPARLDSFRVSTATPPRPPVDEVFPTELELPSTAAPSTPASTEAPAAGNEVGEDEISAAFERALTDPPQRTTSSPGMARAPLPHEEVSPEPAEAHAWYLGVDEKQLGPLSKQAVRQLWMAGEVGPDTLAWREGLPDWLAVSRIVDFMDLTATPSGPPSEPPVRNTSTRNMPELALSALVQQELSAITATAVTQPPKKNLPIAGPAGMTPRRTQSLLDLPAQPGPTPAFDPETQPHLDLSSAAAAQPELEGRSADTERPTSPGILPLSLPTPGQEPAPSPARPPPFRHGQLPAGWARNAILGLAVADLLLVGIAAVVSLTRPPLVQRVMVEVPAPAPLPPVVEVIPSRPPPPLAAEPKAETDTETPPPAADVAEENGRAPVAIAAAKSPAAPVAKPAAKVIPPAAPAVPQKKVASVGNAAQNDRDFKRMFPDEKPPPTPKAAPRHDVYVPPPPGKGPMLVSLASSDVMDVVLAHRRAIETCAVEQGRQKPNLHGTLVMKFLVQPSGKVGNVLPVTEGLQKTYLARCLGKEISRWHFPKHQKVGDPISFPFKF